MRLKHILLSANVLPTVVVVSVLILVGMLGLLALWEQEMLLYARSARLRQARADVESAFTRYLLHPSDTLLTARAGCRLFDSLPGSGVRVVVRPWGLYDAVVVTTADSLVTTSRLFGVEPDTIRTLTYADARSAVTLAGKTVLKGMLHLPQNGMIYGRVEADFYTGEQLSKTVIRHAEASLPTPLQEAEERIVRLFSGAECPGAGLSDSLRRPFCDSTLRLQVGNAEIAGCTLKGNIVLYADELRIDASCRIRDMVICARKVTVGRGARLSAQIFVLDTVLVEPGVVLEYPSGIYSQSYVELGDEATIDGYIIIRDTVIRKKPSSNYHQSRAARVRGLLYVDGVAQVQGIVSGQMILRQATYFSRQGYYKDLLYDVTLLVNPLTAHPLWLVTGRRKEAVCAD